MRFQVAINDDRDTTFTALNGKYSKIYSNPQGFLASHSYKNEQGFLNALKKVITSDSVTKAWNEDGTPNTNFKL